MTTFNLALWLICTSHPFSSYGILHPGRFQWLGSMGVPTFHYQDIAMALGQLFPTIVGRRRSSVQKISLLCSYDVSVHPRVEHYTGQM